jgi:hypothetical protein
MKTRLFILTLMFMNLTLFSVKAEVKDIKLEENPFWGESLTVCKASANNYKVIEINDNHIILVDQNKNKITINPNNSNQFEEQRIYFNKFKNIFNIAKKLDKNINLNFEITRTNELNDDPVITGDSQEEICKNKILQNISNINLDKDFELLNISMDLDNSNRGNKKFHLFNPKQIIDQSSSSIIY